MRTKSPAALVCLECLGSPVEPTSSTVVGDQRMRVYSCACGNTWTTPCRARRHDTAWAYANYRCYCPLAIAAARKAWWRAGQRKTCVRLADWAKADSACAGERATLNLAERRMAIDSLIRFGLRNQEIALRLHISTRTVERRRAALRAGAQPLLMWPRAA